MTHCSDVTSCCKIALTGFAYTEVKSCSSQLFLSTEEAVSNQQEIDRIDAQLKELIKKKAELQNIHDNLLNAKDTHDKKKSESKFSTVKTFFIILKLSVTTIFLA